MGADVWSREDKFGKFSDKPVKAIVNSGDQLVSTHVCSCKEWSFVYLSMATCHEQVSRDSLAA